MNADVNKRALEEAVRKINSIDQRLFVDWEKKFFPKWDNLLNVNELYYYTDTNTFMNGIVTKEQDKGKEICLWASRWSHLNDTSENAIGLELMKEMQTPSDVVEQIKSNINNNHSISLSTQCDELPLWSMYGDGGNGVMLVFDCDQLLDIYDGRLQYCIYKDSKYDDSFIQTMANLNLGKQFEKLDNTTKQYVVCVVFMMYCSIIKNKKYEYEQEVRIVGCGNKFFDKSSKEIYYRYSNNRVIPYVKEYLPKQSLKKVYLGPLANIELSQNTLKEFLDSKGFNHVDVCTSEIPYRG